MIFSDFFGDPSPFIQEMAKNLDTYSKQLQTGEISADEYKDLCDDATTLSDVATAGQTIQELAILDKAIAMLKEIAESFI